MNGMMAVLKAIRATAFLYAFLRNSERTYRPLTFADSRTAIWNRLPVSTDCLPIVTCVQAPIGRLLVNAGDLLGIIEHMLLPRLFVVHSAVLSCEPKVSIVVGKDID